MVSRDSSVRGKSKCRPSSNFFLHFTVCSLQDICDYFLVLTAVELRFAPPIFILTRDYSKYCFCSLTEILLLNFGPPNFFQSIFVFFYVAQKSVFRSTCSYIVKIFGYILECKNIGQQKMSRLFAFYLFSMGNFG